MLNNVILVGRMVDDPKLVTLDSGYRVTNMVMAVQKPFRNENNEIDTDFIPMQAWMKTAEIVCEYVGKGSILGCKCRLQTRIVEVGELRLRSVEVVVEKVVFISICPRSDRKSMKEKEADDVETNPPEELNLDDKALDGELNEKETNIEKPVKKEKIKK